ncbi:hypothetical protein DL768_002290 [Monosporascus sp. mg162]|nr:hypothetical protein DL768_002290 [Monosporascus sp. mg162]
MKIVLSVVGLFASAAIAAAVPEGQGWYLRRADEMDQEDLPIVDLEVTDDRHEGVTFYGTAQSIYEQIKELDPEAFANVTETSLDSLTARALEERQGSFNCGWGNLVGNWVTQCSEGLNYLRNLGTRWCGVNAAPACARVSCSHNCGMFLCNKLGHHLQVHCQDIATDIEDIAVNCQSQVFARTRGARDFASHFIGLSQVSC